MPDQATGAIAIIGERGAGRPFGADQTQLVTVTIDSHHIDRQGVPFEHKLLRNRLYRRSFVGSIDKHLARHKFRVDDIGVGRIDKNHFVGRRVKQAVNRRHHPRRNGIGDAEYGREHQAVANRNRILENTKQAYGEVAIGGRDVFRGHHLRAQVLTAGAGERNRAEGEQILIICDGQRQGAEGLVVANLEANCDIPSRTSFD